MLPIDLSGKRAFIAGVADDRGYGWAIVRALAAAGASICEARGLRRSGFLLAVSPGENLTCLFRVEERLNLRRSIP